VKYWCSLEKHSQLQLVCLVLHANLNMKHTTMQGSLGKFPNSRVVLVLKQHS